MLHDKDIREPLFDFLEETYGRIRIIEEKTMGRSRADIVIVMPEALCGIEIKSDADTYSRLAGQVRDYDQYFDFNIAVVGSSHGLHIREHVPEYWGIITVEEAEEGIDFYFLQRPRCNPKMKWDRKLSVLWRPELAQIQVWNDMPKYKDKSREFVSQKIAERVPEKIPEDVLKEQISELLFERDYNEAPRMLADYRKGEIQKKLERETDPARKLELMIQQAETRRRSENIWNLNRK